MKEVGCRGLDMISEGELLRGWVLMKGVGIEGGGGGGMEGVTVGRIHFCA